MSGADSGHGAQEYFSRAVECHREGRLDDAVESYRRVIALAPGQPDVLHLLGVACYQRGDAENAEPAIRAAIEAHPTKADYHSNLGLVLNALGRHDEAIEAFGRALEIDSGFTDCMNNLGMTCIAAGRLEMAEQVFRQLLAADPDHAEGCNNLAVLLGRESFSEEASRLFERALRLRPDYLDATLNHARMLLRCEDFAAAARCFEAALVLAPGDVALLGELADAQHKAGDIDGALKTSEKAAASAPDDAELKVTMGNVLLSQGRTPDAEALYRQAIELDPGNARAWNNLGTIHLRNDDVDKALECFTTALKTDPGFTEAQVNKGTALRNLGRLAEATGFFINALAHNPRIPHAYRYLSEIYRVCEMPESQIKVLREWLVHYPDSATARHFLHAAQQEAAPERAADDFIREEFDDFAEDFDDTLAKLNYRTPQLVGDMLRNRFPAAARDWTVLDAGCGTGLCAPELRSFCAELVGVDLSEKMLEKARLRGLYDELVAGELVAFMDSRPANFDLIVAADTFVYFGPLEEVLRASAKALRAAGRIVFSLETGADGDADYCLNANGRYAHAEEYARRAMSEAGFEIDEIRHCVLRDELSKGVDGMIVIGQLSPSGTGVE